ncbi:MAG: hypothetical protein KC635_29345 [Myxococcales bacterium]|nr:hypothetical protein [Myxococcales bacterium]MCB9735926.1 hypothetical protein [Deltaproteobacteria bacterium]
MPDRETTAPKTQPAPPSPVRARVKTLMSATSGWAARLEASLERRAQETAAASRTAAFAR